MTLDTARSIVAAMIALNLHLEHGLPLEQPYASCDDALLVIRDRSLRDLLDANHVVAEANRAASLTPGTMVCDDWLIAAFYVALHSPPCSTRGVCFLPDRAVVIRELASRA